ncbi:MAG: ABC transporter substrate-binding protein, partial [Ruminococcus sp.]|nr:ABC transporter substrate-binding protein [Ruminococcus sp.]
MKKITIKRSAAVIVALLSAFAAASCSSANSEKKTTETSVETVVVEDTNEIEAIPDDAEKEIRWLGTYDLNPSKGQDKTVEMTLFNNKGGSVVWDQVIDSEKFDKLASALMSKKNMPDIFKYEWMAFPCQVVKDMYQPVDEIVDFDSDLWADTKPTAEQFVLDGKHYVAPISFEPTTYMMYDYAVVESEGLDDPYET